VRFAVELGSTAASPVILVFVSGRKTAGETPAPPNPRRLRTVGFV